jgi:hypothetical protein
MVLVLIPVMAWCLVSWFRDSSESTFYQSRRAFGWLALCVAPLPFVNLLFHAIREWRADGFLEGLAVTVLQWPVLLGGQTVISVFEANVKDWTGHRRDTMLDNSHVFLALTVVQALVLSLLVYRRLRKGKTWRDPLLRGVGLFMLVNGWMAMDWPWYGT